MHYHPRMKRLLIICTVILTAIVLLTKADGPDDQYIQIYKLIQEGDQLIGVGRSELARER